MFYKGTESVSFLVRGKSGVLTVSLAQIESAIASGRWWLSEYEVSGPESRLHDLPTPEIDHITPGPHSCSREMDSRSH